MSDRAQKLPQTAWLIPAGLLLGVALILIFGPQEATLGQGIKIIYVHVAVTWTAMLLIAVQALLGLVQAITAKPAIQSWTRLLAPVVFGIYLLTTILGMISSRVNWGGIAWTEPRTIANLNTMAVVLVVFVLYTWLKQPRLLGLLYLFQWAFMMWVTVGADLELHPSNPIRSSESFAIQAAFYGMFALVFLGTLWLVWYLRRRQS